MIQFFRNVHTIAIYESKLLVRSWFFKVFSVLAILGLGGFSYSILFQDQNWAITCIPSLYPYVFMLILSVGQAVVSIFLASEYLKRDKQLDTSEVFYVRPSSNAEYLIGKIWGTLRVFFALDLILLACGAILLTAALGYEVDYFSFLTYFLLLGVPTLIFIVGLSTTIMLFIRNQALTFVIVLGYIGLTLFYISDYFYYLFDYLGFNIPMIQSTITGFSDLDSLIRHRIIYLLLGLGLICFCIFKFGRLPNSNRKRYAWPVYGAIFIIIGLWEGWKHVSSFLDQEQIKEEMITLNNEHVNDPKMVIDSCFFDIKQEGDELKIQAEISGKPVQSSSVFTFCLNPGLKIKEITRDGNSISYTRLQHLILINFGEEIQENETVKFLLTYQGKIDERICYLDIPEEVLIQNEKIKGSPFITSGKRYAYQSENYILLTPESYWYPRPGVSYSNQSPDWQQSYFTRYRMKVTPSSGLIPISQGIRTENTPGTFEFAPDQLLQSVSLIIGNYKEFSTIVDSTEYSIKYIDGHDHFSTVFDSIADTIPALIREIRRDFENSIKLDYPFNRFSFVEVPAQFATYSRTWTKAQETMQPEMVLIREKGYNRWNFNFQGQIKWRKEAMERGWERKQTEEQLLTEIFRNGFWFLNDPNSDIEFKEGKLGRASMTIQENPYYIFPQMFNFRYNIYSAEWPIANRLIELFFLGGTSDQWIRNINGLSNDEKALLMMQERSFKDLLTEVEYRSLINNFVNISSGQLFAEGQMKMGFVPFRDSLLSIVKSNEFKNLSFEYLLDSLGKLASCDLFKPMEMWTKPSKLPEYLLGTPKVTSIQTQEKDIYQAEIVISNISEFPGYLKFGLHFNSSFNSDYGPGMKPRQWIIHFDPKETKRIVSHWEEEYPMLFLINGLYAKNLPLAVNLPSGSIEESRILTPEGEHPVSSDFLKNKGEIIVDNEDSLLFSLSAPPTSGLLNHWIDQSMQDDFKYTALRNWRPPSRWTAATDESYYGLSIRSAYGIRSGDGSQTATWKIPLETRGKHEIYYYLRKPDELRWNHGRRGRDPKQYNFTISYGGYSEEVALDLNRVDDNSWVLLGTYDIDSDTIAVTLSDKSELRMVIADAVKAINIDQVGKKRPSQRPRGPRPMEGRR